MGLLALNPYFYTLAKTNPNSYKQNLKPMKKSSSLLLIIFASLLMLSFTQCKSSKQAAVATAGPAGETLVEQYCDGPQYQSTKDFFRTTAVGESMDQNVSKQRAMTNARTLMAQQVEVVVKNVTDSYIKLSEFNLTEDLEQRYEGLTREVANQKLGGARVICEQVTRTANGNYKTYIALELSGDEMVSALGQRLSNDEKLRIDFHYDRFKSTFEKEMQDYQ